MPDYIQMYFWRDDKTEVIHTAGVDATYPLFLRLSKRIVGRLLKGPRPETALEDWMMSHIGR